MCLIKRAKELQYWVIISIKYMDIKKGRQNTCIDAKGIKNTL
jgi:hypothetical protein